MARNPMRLAQGIDGVSLHIWDGLTMNLVGCSTVKFQIARQGDSIVARLRQGFTNVLRLKCRQ